MSGTVYIKSLPVEELAEVAALAEYEAEKLVRKKLVANDALTIYLWACDKGTQGDVDAAPGGVMIQILEGRGELIIDPSPPQRLETGAVHLIPPETAAVFEAPNQSKVLLTCVHQPEAVQLSSMED